MSVEVKVICIGDVTYIAGDKRKQDITVADHTGNAKVTLWEDYTNKLELHKSYSLRCFTVREYSSKKYLSMPGEGAEIVTIDDIGTIDADSPNESDMELLQLS